MMNSFCASFSCCYSQRSGLSCLYFRQLKTSFLESIHGEETKRQREGTSSIDISGHAHIYKTRWSWRDRAGSAVACLKNKLPNLSCEFVLFEPNFTVSFVHDLQNYYEVLAS